MGPANRPAKENHMRLASFLLLFAITLFGLACAYTASESGTGGSSDVANGGFDTVAYFALERATEGSNEFAAFYNGAKWLFSNKENLEAFKNNPEKYIPQFGSHCPVSLSQGGKEEGSPQFWHVHKNRVYLFYNEANRDRFKENPEQYIDLAKKAEKQE